MHSETTKKYIASLIEKAVHELGLPISLGSFTVERNPKFGHFSTNAAKKLGGNAQVAAQNLADKLAVLDSKDKHYFSKVDSGAGFINFILNENSLIRRMRQINKEKDSFGSSAIGKGKTVIVEYFQLNTAKQPHVGHMRSAVIGDALKRIIKFQGYKTLSDTHVGDWGTQFGIMIAAYKKFGDKSVIEKNLLEELEKLYVHYNVEMENNPELREVGKQEFAKLEAGDKENRKLWEWMNEVSMQKLFEMAKLLQLEEFDLHLGESFYEDKMQDILGELAKSKLSQVGKDGEIFVDLEQYKLDQAILKKSDGGTTYLLRDLAKVKYVWNKYKYFKNIYVVDVRQSHHFRQVFKIAELAKWQGVEDCLHIDYGFMKLPEGMLSTRAGNTIALEKVVDEATQRAKKIILEKNPSLKNKDHIAYLVGLAALKYFDLSHNSKSDIVFTWEKALSFEGNTGPYLQYTHARIHGILRKIQNSNNKFQTKSEISRPQSLSAPADGGQANLKSDELNVLGKLDQFPEIVEQVANDYSPNQICNYLFELSQSFNSFYEVLPVLKEEKEELKNFRLNLCRATAQVIKNGLNLLGIQAPEEM